MNFERIKIAMDEYAASTSSPVGMGFKDLNGGEEYYIDGDSRFPTESIFKIWVMIELHRMAEKGELSFSDRWELKDEDRSIGSGVLQQIGSGAALTVADYCFLMMSISDNTATDTILSHVTLDRVQRLADSMGLKSTIIRANCSALCEGALSTWNEDDVKLVGRHTLRFLPAYSGELECNDYSTPAELVKTLEMLYRGTVPDTASESACLEVMKKCQTNSRIPKLLPSTVPVAHKTGSMDRVANDAGIVYTNCGDYILVMMDNGNMATDIEEFKSNQGGFRTDRRMALLSKEIFDAYRE